MHSLSIATWTFILSHFSLSFTWFIIIFLVGVGCVFSTYYLNFEFYFEVRSNWCNGVFIMVKVNHDIANDLGVDVELEELYQLSMWVSDIMVENLRFFKSKVLVDETLVLVYLDGQNDIACMLERRLYIPWCTKSKVHGCDACLEFK